MSESVLNAERAVLGGLLDRNSDLAAVTLDRSMFMDHTHGEVFQAIVDLSERGSKADLVTVWEYLERTTGRDGWGPILGKYVQGWGVCHAEHYAPIVQTASMQRKAKAIAESLADAKDPESIDVAIRGLMDLNIATGNHECSIKAAMTSAVDDLDKAYQMREAGKIVGIPTGLGDLDHALGGLHASDLIVVGARPSMGKTSLMLNFANNANVPIGIISAEQPAGQLAQRLIAINGRISAHNMRTGNISDHEWPCITSSVSNLAEKSIWINDKPRPTIAEVVRQARRWKYDHNIKALYVDYLQRLKGNERDPIRERIMEAVMAMKEIARELDIPVVTLAQVKREVDSRSNKRPHMGDLQEAGAIEQEADQIILMYRDDVYDPDSSSKGIAELNIEKNRHGPTGVIRVAWLETFMRTENLAIR